MKRWLKRIRGALGMGLTWALGWGLIGGAIMEGIVDPDGQIVDMWPQLLAMPGFLLGVLFSIALWMSERRRRFDELSIPRFATIGAAAGAVLGTVFLAAGIFPGIPLLLRAAVVLAPLTVLSAASATGTLALARLAVDRGLLKAAHNDELDLPAHEAQDRLPGRN